MNLDRVFYGNSVGAWLAAVGVLLVSVLAIRIVEKTALSRLSRLATRTATGVDDIFAHVLGRTRAPLVIVVAVFVASLSLALDPALQQVLQRAAVIALVVQGGLWASAAVAFWVERFEQRSSGDPAAVTTVSALSFIVRLAVGALVLLLILDNLGVEVTALLTGLGIGGIAVALAAQNILGDLFASLSIVLDRPFVLGDFLVVGDHKGKVEHIGLKTTRLRALGGEQLVLGNKDLLDSRIQNLGRMSDRRASFAVGVTYDTPRERLAVIADWIREIVESHPHTRFDRSHLKQFGAYSIDFETVYYVTVPEYATYMDIQQAINLAIHEKFEHEEVEFAFPTQVVYTLAGDATG